MFEEIDRFVGRCIDLTEEEKAIFHESLQLCKVKKKQMLLKAGEVCQFEAYVKKGCLRFFYVDENGFDVILHFAIEDWWLGDIASFSRQIPSLFYIEALEDSELLCIPYPEKEKLFSKVPKFERLFRIMVQRAYETMMNRLIATMAKSAEERYLHFLQKYPKIIQRVPQHFIASHLGVSPEFLSKIRKKLSQKKA